MSFKDVRGAGASYYESTKPSSTPFSSTNKGIKIAAYQSVAIGSPLGAIENKSNRPAIKAGDTPLVA